MTKHIEELRRRARLCRRAAGVPTAGSANADRILLEVAEQFEREADLRERQWECGVPALQRDMH